MFDIKANMLCFYIKMLFICNADQQKLSCIILMLFNQTFFENTYALLLLIGQIALYAAIIIAGVALLNWWDKRRDQRH